jgi:uncharacterized paraquat-inducible protein A
MLKKHIGYSLNVIAIALFFPGIFLPMFNLTMTMNANVSGAALTTELVSKNLSLLQTIQELYQDERLFVALLILSFSIVIPLAKFTMLNVAYLKKHTVLEARIYNTIGVIGKWSMADVFVVAVFLAVLSTNHAETATQQQLALLGFKLNLTISSETLSGLGQGFYYFSAYCLLSLLGTQLCQSSVKYKHVLVKA